MTFKMPETLDGLSLAQISKLSEDALAAAMALNEIPDEQITEEQSAALIELVGHIDTITARQGEMETAAAEGAERLAAARSRMAEVVTPEEGEDESEAPAAEDGAEVEVEEREAVLASASKRSFTSKAAKGGTPTPPAAPDAPSGALSLVAAANISGFTSGQELQSFDELATAFVNRGKSFASGSRGGKAKGGMGHAAGSGFLSPNATRFSVAKLQKAESDFTITEKMSAEEQFNLVQQVAKESRLKGSSLLAAGGWCSPSEQIWSFCELETTEGLLSIPEMVARRGGVTWTPGPQLADLLSDPNFGFVQTETEAEAGTAKACYDVECPDWQEERLDAIGFCIKSGLLTNATYPELVRRVLSLGLIAHARTVNATTIARISAAIGAATVFAPVLGTNYSSTSDILAAAELTAIRVRETHAMALGATLESIFPIWAKGLFRAELSRRAGVDMFNISDQMIVAWFAQRGVAAQFVRDYQPINTGAETTAGGTAGWTRYPDKMEFMVYPAGAYVRMGTDVIDLDTVYDTAGLTTNTYTAAFFEEGFGLLNTCGTGVKVQVATNNLTGAAGFPAIGSGAGVTFTTP